MRVRVSTGRGYVNFVMLGLAILAGCAGFAAYSCNAAGPSIPGRAPPQALLGWGVWFAWPLLTALAWRFTSSVAVFGGDGVSLERAGYYRFVSYAAVAHVAIERGVVLYLTDGKTVTLRTSGVRWGSRRVLDEEAIAKTVLERLERFRARGVGAPDPLVHVANGDRHTWLRNLRALASGATSYRAPEADSDALYALLDDPTEPADRRAAAAFVLKLRVPTEAGDRIRIAATAAANPELRDALEAVIHDAPDDAAKKLARLR